MLEITALPGEIEHFSLVLLTNIFPALPLNILDIRGHRAKNIGKEPYAKICPISPGSAVLGKKFFLAHTRQFFIKIRKNNLRYLEIPFFISNGKEITKTIIRTCYAYDIFKLKALARSAGLKVIAHKVSKANIWLELSC